VTALPGGLPVAELQAALRRWTSRGDLVVEDVTCTPIAHRISAPTTRALTRVRVHARDGEGAPVAVGLVAKELQAARYGLPPQMPDGPRAHLDRTIPWRMEADVLASGVRERAPEGLVVPAVVLLHEQSGDRLTLWTEEVDVVEGDWTADDVERAAHLLGRLAGRRAGDTLPPLPADDFLTSYRDDVLGTWAVPSLEDDATWEHPLFRVPAVAALREEVLAVGRRAADVHAALGRFPVLPAHGDATPMNLLRPRSAPGSFVVVDWGTSTPAPVGFDVVPLVFGAAENGSGPADELPELVGRAVPAYRDGLAAEGVGLPLATVRAAVLGTALLRYPCTGLPLHVLSAPVTDALLARAEQQAAFVRTVLDLTREVSPVPV
jgi:hypothetical protein